MTSYSIAHYEQDLLPEIFQEIQKLAQVKGGEYAYGDDRLENFRRNAKNNGVEKETCWSIYAGKHWDAIQTYVRDLQTGVERPRSESIKGRALDLMVYLTLFIAMVEEREVAPSSLFDPGPTKDDEIPF